MNISIGRKIDNLIDYVVNIIRVLLLTYCSGYADRYKKKNKRKIVCGFGRCHISVYRYFLNQSKTFRENYLFLRMPGMNAKKMGRIYSKVLKEDRFWRVIDVFIYNHGYMDNPRMPQIAEIMPKLSEGATIIPISHLAFKGYFPQHTTSIFANEQMFTWGDKNLNKILAEDVCGERIKEILSDTYYTKEFAEKYFEKSLHKLKEYETNCEVGIADYIEQYGKKEILYYSTTHPEMKVMYEVSMRLLDRLGIDRKEVEGVRIENAPQLNTNGEIVYPSICRGLGMDSSMCYGRKIRPGKKVEYYLEEYIMEYIAQGLDAKERR